MFRKLKTFFVDDDGATLAEYGIALIVGIVLGGSALVALSADISTQVLKPGAIYSANG